jgi:hypothetical protein
MLMVTVVVAFMARLGWDLGGLLVRLVAATWELLVSA